MGNKNLYYTHGQFRGIEGLGKKRPGPKAKSKPETASKYGIADGDEMLIETNRGTVRVGASVQRVAEGVVLVPTARREKRTPTCSRTRTAGSRSWATRDQGAPLLGKDGRSRGSGVRIR